MTTVGSGGDTGAGGGRSSRSLDGAGGGDVLVVVVDGFVVVVLLEVDVVVDGFVVVVLLEVDGGLTSRVVCAGGLSCFALDVDLLAVLLDDLLLLDDDLLPDWPPDFATSLGGIRQTLGEAQTDHSDFVAAVPSEAWVEQARQRQAAWATQVTAAQN